MREHSRKFSGREVEIDYSITGENNKETLMFVHGVGANLDQFKHQHEYFSKTYKVISVSLRGHGQSSLPKKINPEAFSLEKNRDDLNELIEHLRLSNIHYIGNSAGGILGFLLNEKNPQCIKSLITFGTTAEMSLPKFATQLVVAIDKIMLKASSEGYLKFTSKHTSKLPETQTAVFEMFTKAVRAIPHFRYHLGNYSCLDILRNMHCPYLLIQSEFDSDINRNLKTTKEAMKLNENTSSVTLDGAGHIANLDQPDLFNIIVGAFIDAVASGKVRAD